MDITALSVFGFSIVKLLIWLMVILFAIFVARKVIKQANSEVVTEGNASQFGDVLWSNKGIIFLWVVVFFAAMFFSQMEAAYRPKTVVQPNNSGLQQELRKLDQAEKPKIDPAEGDTRDKANDGYSKRNREGNVGAREDFKKLPGIQ